MTANDVLNNLKELRFFVKGGGKIPYWKPGAKASGFFVSFKLLITEFCF